MPESENLRIEVLAMGETKWSTNSMEYATRELALEGGQALMDRWMRVEKVRVVPVSTPHDEIYEPGSEDF